MGRPQNIAEPEPDFVVVNHGSIIILLAQSEAAQAWRDAHLPADALTWGPHGTVIEPRYIVPILGGIEEDGFTWQ